MTLLLPKNKGQFIWKVRFTEGGDVDLIAQTAKDCGYDHVVIKIADGIGDYNKTNQYGDTAADLVDALKKKGIDAWGYQYYYGNNPVSEAYKFIQRIEETGVVGGIIDAESEAKLNGDGAASLYMHYLVMNLYLGFPLGLSSYRFPEMHPELSWEIFERGCDFMMPQVYHQGAHNAGEQLEISYIQYDQITDKPYLATGAAYCEHGWCAKPIEVVDFLDTAKELELPGVNFWEWAHTRTNLPDVWKTICEYDYANGTIPPPPPPKPVVIISYPSDKVEIILEGLD